MNNILLHLLTEFWMVLGELSPYLLFGFLIAGILHVLISPETIKKHLGKNKLSSVFKASLFGVPLPLCSCSVIPVATSLKKNGASKGATTSFLISTPQTGVDSIIVTYGLLGPLFAIIRPIFAFISGILGGALVDLLVKEKNSQEIEENVEAKSCCSQHKKTNKLKEALHHGFIAIPKDIGNSLLIGVFIASLITAMIPDDFFVRHLSSGVGTMIIVLLLSIPIYVCSTSSVPIAAALILKGLSPGAALVFLIAGPVSNAATISTIWTVLGKKVTFIYLSTMFISAIAAGIMLDFFFNNIITSQMIEHRMWMMPQPIKDLSIVILLILLIYQPLSSYISKKKTQNYTDKKEHSCCSHKH
ncbi:MAG: SO_0444 family Cu/Zn efflux transporter [Vampirovibrionia bacterium]